ncbi:hypothetical protein ACFQ9X_43320 [Catenulispora yoronensis]
MVTDCEAVSVWVVPYPSNHASHEPPCAGSEAELFRTPLLSVQGAAAPVSKPPLPISCAAVQPPPRRR